MATLKKYQIFLSSTFLDLKKERQEAIGVILDLGQIPSGMEMFPAADIRQLEHIKKIIDQCDYYVLILAARYGSTDEAGISFTELEYDYAVQSGKVVLVFPHEAPDELTKGADVDPVAAARFAAFRTKTMQGRLVKTWTSADNLKSSLIIALHHAMADEPQIGWLRGNAAASEDLLQQINELRLENDQLRDQLSEQVSKNSPRLENLSDLNDTTLIRYTYYTNSGSSVKSIRLPWAEILSIVGPHIMKPAAPMVMDSALHKALKDTGRISPRTSLLDVDVNKIKMQFIALGLLHSYTAAQVGGGLTEFVQLTESGKSRLMEVTVDTKPPPGG